ncbi:hypothetical protein, partial [Burkholderia pseudomallei]|uniref:hypothetical protein n=1 Tax=Burkholderia pseudomallei TaxID=28450 RepID=UPI001E39D759
NAGTHHVQALGNSNFSVISAIPIQKNAPASSCFIEKYPATHELPHFSCTPFIHNFPCEPSNISIFFHFQAGWRISEQ